MPNRLATRQVLICCSTPTIQSTGIPGVTEALPRARAEDKPIFLSIGYSACHWCHVMEHESFENEEIAEVTESSISCASRSIAKNVPISIRST